MEEPLQNKSDEEGIEKRPKSFHVRRWTGFGICALCYMLVHFHRYCPSVLAEEMAPALGVSTSKLGIFSSMYYWSYAVMQPFVGCFADVVEPGYILGFSGLCSAVGSLVCGLSSNFALSSVARFLVGFGCACPYCATTRFMANWFSPRAFYAMTSVLFCLGGIGGLLSQKPLIALGSVIGWRYSLIMIAGFGALFSVLAFVFVRASPVHYGMRPLDGTAQPHSRESFFDRIKQIPKNLLSVVKIGRFWIHSVSVFFSTSCYQNVSGMWAVPYLTDVFGYSNDKASTITLALLMVMVFGSPMLGAISVKFHITKWLQVICVAIAIVCETVFVVWTDRIPELALYPLFFVFGVCTTSTQSFTLPMYKDMVSPDLAATVSGCGNMFIFLGSAIAQSCTAAFLSLFGTSPYSAHAYRCSLWGFCLGSCCVALIAAAVLPMPKSPPPNLESAKTDTLEDL